MSVKRRGKRKIITTGALTSRRLCAVSDFAERLYWRVYMASDNYGTISGDPWDVMLECVAGVNGVTEQRVADACDELVAVGLFQRWDCDAKKVWIHVLGHDNHQSNDFLNKRGQRLTPVPPELEAVENHDVCRDNATRGEFSRAGESSHEYAPSGGAASRLLAASTSISTSIPTTTSNVVRDRGDSEESPCDKTVEPVSPPRRISKPTDEQIEQAIAAHRERLGERNAALVDQLVAVLAEGNKTGKVAASRTLRKLWQPLGDATEQLNSDALTYGLNAALANDAPNANYVKRAAEGYSPSSNVVPISSGPQRQRLSSITDEQLDGWI